MSFNLIEIESKIADRINASPIVPAAQGAWNTVAPPTIQVADGSTPLIIYNLVSAVASDTFVENSLSCVYDVHVYDHIINGLPNLIDVYGKVYGDSEGTDNNPTYGLHRWKITGMTDTADSFVECLSIRTQHEPDILHYVLSFSIEATEA